MSSNGIQVLTDKLGNKLDEFVSDIINMIIQLALKLLIIFITLTIWLYLFAVSIKVTFAFLLQKQWKKSEELNTFSANKILHIFMRSSFKENLCKLDMPCFYTTISLIPFFRNTPGALPKVLLSVQSWDPDTLKVRLE